jgi:hypothetical protein
MVLQNKEIDAVALDEEALRAAFIETNGALSIG